MSPSVSTLVAKTHRLTARPGTMGTCPFCRRKTFAITSDDTLGKCFNAVCSRWVTPTQGEASPPALLHGILMEIFGDFHTALLNQRDSTVRNAYPYLVDERAVHPRVIDHSMIGTVPPNYDLDARFRPVIERIEAYLQEKQQPKERGRPRQPPWVPTPADREFVMAAWKKLERCLNHRRGWLAFFYTDAAHRIVAIDDVRRLEGPKGLKQFEVYRLAAEIVITDLRDRGRFYHDGRLTYYFFDTEKQLVSLERDSQELQLTLYRYGILPTETLYRYVLAALHLDALEHGTRTQVYAFIHYDRSTATL